MQSTTFIRRGDIVIYHARFSDFSGGKNRPSVIVSAAAFHRGRKEVVLAHLTTNVSTRLERIHPTDREIPPAGLGRRRIAGVIGNVRRFGDYRPVSIRAWNRP